MKSLPITAFAVALFSGTSVYADWQGWYVGAGLGDQELSADWSTEQFYDPVDGSAFPVGDSSKESLEDSGIVAGLYVGQNFELASRWITGWELHLTKASLDDKANRIPGFIPGGDSEIEVEAGNEAALLARLGYLATPKLLVFASLGASFRDFEATTRCYADGDFCNPATGLQENSEDGYENGWVMGLGVEALLTDTLSVRLDYRRADYGSFDVNGMNWNQDRFGVDAEVDAETDTLSAGVSYSF